MTRTLGVFRLLFNLITLTAHFKINNNILEYLQLHSCVWRLSNDSGHATQSKAILIVKLITNKRKQLI